MANDIKITTVNYNCNKISCSVHYSVLASRVAYLAAAISYTSKMLIILALVLVLPYIVPLHPTPLALSIKYGETAR